MTIFLFICSAVAFLIGCIVFAAAKGSVHEVEALILFLVSTVFFCSMAIVSAINRLSKRMDATPTPRPAKADSEQDVPFPPKAPDFVPAAEPAIQQPKAEPVAPRAMPVQSWVEEARAELNRGKP